MKKYVAAFLFCMTVLGSCSPHCLPERGDWDRIFLVESGQECRLDLDGLSDIKEIADVGTKNTSGKDLIIFSKDSGYVYHRFVSLRSKGWKKYLSGYDDMDLTSIRSKSLSPYFNERYVGKWPEGDGVMYGKNLVFGRFSYGKPVGVCECYLTALNRIGDIYVGEISDGEFDGKGVYYCLNCKEIIEGTFLKGQLEGDVICWKPQSGEVLEFCIASGRIQKPVTVHKDSSSRFRGRMPEKPCRVLTDYQEDYIDIEPVLLEYEHIEPSFEGGDCHVFSKWVHERLVYPEEAKAKGIQGKVTLAFTVEVDGNVDKIKVLRGICPALDEEAARVVGMSPKWTPGERLHPSGLFFGPIPVTFTFPVFFNLPTGKEAGE